MNVYILKSFKYEYSKPMMKLAQNRLEECCDGLKPFSYKCFRELDETNECCYYTAVKTEGRLSDNYHRYIKANLSRLSPFHKSEPFKYETCLFLISCASLKVKIHYTNGRGPIVSP